MNCLQIQEMISLYIDDQLDECTKEEVKNHLKECQECKDEYKMMLECISLCKDLTMVDLPEDFTESLHEKLVDVQKSEKNINWKAFASVAAMLVIGITSMSLFHSTKDIEEQISTTPIEYSSPKESNPKKNIENKENLEGTKKDIKTPKVDVKKHLSQKESNGPQNSASDHENLEEESFTDEMEENSPKMAFYAESQEVPSVFMTIHIPKDEFVQIVQNVGGNLEASKENKMDEIKTKRNLSQMEDIIVYIPQERLAEFEQKSKESGRVIKYSIENENITKDDEDNLESIQNLQTQEIKLKEEEKNLDEKMEFCTIYVSLYDN